MKNYCNPVIELEKLSIDDVVLTSVEVEHDFDLGGLNDFDNLI